MEKIEDSKKSKEMASQRKAKLSKDKYVENLRMQISELSYEDSLDQLDILLDKLKSESLLVEDIQKSVLQGSFYIQHCEKLLDQTEQEVLEINEDELI